MKFLHKPIKAQAGDLIRVEFSKPTRVLLIHSRQFEKYKKGKTYHYRGGPAETSPVEFTVPFEGVWHAVIEKGTYRNPIDLTGNAELIKQKPATLNGAEQNETHTPVEEYDDTLE